MEGLTHNRCAHFCVASVIYPAADRQAFRSPAAPASAEPVRKCAHSQSGLVRGLYRGVHGGVLFALRYRGWGDGLGAGGAAERGGVAVRARHLAAGRDGASRDGAPESMPQDLAQVPRVGVPGGQRL